MMIIKVCIGSSCHLKGSREVVEKFQDLIQENKLEDEIKLVGKFCMGQCQKGVNVTIDDLTISVDRDEIEEVFNQYVKGKLKPNE
ncbi:(2Fe-2S) ferredoxin domain-containing protein [Mycoplasmatota bacterium]|nr:(2Fe-2S) ferredoxin domain-containing protein [Mycoplasmatota bacterium]